MKIRLNKFLAQAGVSSRRNADVLIADGRISVNGKIITELGHMIDLSDDIVALDGKQLKPSNPLIYYALYKPRGVVSTARDEKGRQAVVDLVPPYPRVYPIGRLDADSEGLMILTNDGDLTQKLTHPSFQHEKEYEVIARIMNKELRIKANTEQIIRRNFLEGMTIGGQLMKADSVHVTLLHDSCFVIHMTLHTGLNRQIRKMCAKIGLEVLQLTRVRIGKLTLNSLNLKPGGSKQITKEQII